MEDWGGLKDGGLGWIKGWMIWVDGRMEDETGGRMGNDWGIERGREMERDGERGGRGVRKVRRQKEHEIKELRG